MCFLHVHGLKSVCHLVAKAYVQPGGTASDSQRPPLWSTGAPFPPAFHAASRRLSVPSRTLKVDDANMPSDFLTKWVPTKKLAISARYATNSRAGPDPPDP